MTESKMRHSAAWAIPRLIAERGASRRQSSLSSRQRAGDEPGAIVSARLVKIAGAFIPGASPLLPPARRSRHSYHTAAADGQRDANLIPPPLCCLKLPHRDDRSAGTHEGVRQDARLTTGCETMNFSQRLTFLFSAPMFDADDLEGLRVSQIIAAIERMGFQVIKARRLEDAEIAVQTDAAIGCMVVDWGKKGIEGKAASLINLMRKRGLDMPIVVLIRRKRFEDIPVEVLDFIDGYVFLAEETPEFIARNLVSRLKQYADTLKTPFFGALVDYQEEGNQLWTCPGHNGGVFYSRSPIGRIFVEHLGEAVFRDDLDNSILELGDLLTHEGPALQAQKEAAAIFGAEKTYFVLNGTSSSNKIVCTNLIAEDDLVLFDRNNHKAAHQGALLMGGGIPIYLSADRNAYGLIGPIRLEDFDETRLRERIRDNPLVTDKEAWKRERPFRAAVIEQCTYDGTIYDAESIIERIGRLCDYVVFDEAWAGFMKFHPLYERRFAMGLKRLEVKPRQASSRPSRRTSSSRVSRRRPRFTCAIATSKGSAVVSSIAASMKASCSSPRPRRSIRCSLRSMSARR